MTHKTEYETWNDERNGVRHNPWPRLVAQFLCVAAAVIVACVYFATYARPGE